MTKMEEEKAASHGDELTCKGERAAMFKQGLGFSSSAPNDDIPKPSSSFLSKFVEASSESKKQAQLQSIHDNLKKYPSFESRGLTLNCMDRKSEAYELVDKLVYKEQEVSLLVKLRHLEEGKALQSSTLEDISDKILHTPGHMKDFVTRKQNFPRVEFLHCMSCRKEHKLRLKSKPNTKNYHDALTNKYWTCYPWPYQKIFFPHMTTGDPPQQKTSQGNEKKNEDENITQAEFYAFKRYFSLLEEELKNITKGDPPQWERSRKISIKKKFKNIAQGDLPKQKRSQGNEKKTEDDNITQVNVTLEAFQKHALRERSGRWKRNIWVHFEDEDKVPLWKTPLIKYYTHQSNVVNRKDSAMRKQNIHRDEFLRCTKCGKERRFHLKSRPDIKNYHDALNNKCWTCSLWPYQKITCDDYEERSSLKASRGCSCSSTCQDCSTCYCEGVWSRIIIIVEVKNKIKGFLALDLVTGDPPQEERRPSKRRKQFRVGDDGKILFDEEELKMILDFKIGEDYIEFVCGATNKKYGDYVGRLKINNKGQYFITCECCLECPLVNVTIEAFEKHALREGSGRWKRNIWLYCTDEDKVPL
ncbi:Protein ULTRAPETALA 1 [Glycine soja]